MFLSESCVCVRVWWWWGSDHVDDCVRWLKNYWLLMFLLSTLLHFSLFSTNSLRFQLGSVHQTKVNKKQREREQKSWKKGEWNNNNNNNNHNHIYRHTHTSTKRESTTYFHYFLFLKNIMCAIYYPCTFIFQKRVLWLKRKVGMEKVQKRWWLDDVMIIVTFFYSSCLSFFLSFLHTITQTHYIIAIQQHSKSSDYSTKNIILWK